VLFHITVVQLLGNTGQIVYFWLYAYRNSYRASEVAVVAAAVVPFIAAFIHRAMKLKIFCFIY